MTLFLILMGAAFALCFIVVIVAYCKAPVIEDVDDSPVRDQPCRGDLHRCPPRKFLSAGLVTARSGNAGLNLPVRRA
jgi:hypothetical protein